jgi:hypothetical protein
MVGIPYQSFSIFRGNPGVRVLERAVTCNILLASSASYLSISCSSRSYLRYQICGGIF